MSAIETAFLASAACSIAIANSGIEEDTMLRVCSTAFVIVTMLAGSAFAQKPPAPAESASAKAPVVNLNTATTAELEQLPGIGAKVAARIVEYRTKKGPFKKIEELMNVQGVGEKSFLKLRAQLTVSGTAASTSQQQ